MVPLWALVAADHVSTFIRSLTDTIQLWGVFSSFRIDCWFCRYWFLCYYLSSNFWGGFSNNWSGLDKLRLWVLRFRFCNWCLFASLFYIGWLFLLCWIKLINGVSAILIVLLLECLLHRLLIVNIIIMEILLLVSSASKSHAVVSAICSFIVSSFTDEPDFYHRFFISPPAGLQRGIVGIDLFSLIFGLWVCPTEQQELFFFVCKLDLLFI